MAGWTAGCVIGIQDDYENPYEETPFKLAYGSKAVIPAEVHMANHRVMKDQDEENEKQLHFNHDLINEVRMDVEQKTARYKSLWLGNMM